MKNRICFLLISLLLCSGLFAQIFDNALSFDGTDDYASIPHSSMFNVSALTLEMWVYWENPVSDDVDFLIGKATEELEIHTGGGASFNGLRFIPTDNIYLDTPTGVLPQNEWHHIAFIYDPSSSFAACYIDGNEVALTNNGLNGLNTPITSSSESLLLGSRNGGSYYYAGKLDEVRIWNDVRTQAEIREYMYKHLTGSEDGLVAYYNMTGTLTTLTDQSTNAINGTLVGPVRVANSYVAYSEGTGTQADPFHINSLTDLMILSAHIELWNNHYMQTADIDASETSAWNNGLGFSPIGTDADHTFNGSYNGQYYSIDHLTINRPTQSWCGLFGYIEGDTLQGIRLKDIYVNASSFSGGLVGAGHYIIKECSVDGTVTGVNYLGGIVGYGGGGCQIISTYNAADVNGGYHIGGIAGVNYLSDLINCYNTGNINGLAYLGGLAGETRDSVLNCYSSGSVIGLSSTDVYPLVGKLNTEDFIKNCVYNSDSCAALGAHTNSIAKTSDEMMARTTYTSLGWDMADTWNMSVIINDGYPYLKAIEPDIDLNSLAPTQGDGSVLDPYQIANSKNLYWLSQNPSQWSGHYVQTANINAAFTSELDNGAGWTPIGNLSTAFSGSYHGMDHVIDSLYVSRASSSYIGLFGDVDCDTIQHLGLRNANILGLEYVGGLLGSGDAFISHCYATGQVQGTNYIGGLAGMLNYSSDIKYSCNKASVTAGDYGGGLGGFLQCPVSNCYNTAHVTVNNFGGGLAGKYKANTITNSYSIANVTGSTSNALVGEYKGGAILSNCFWNSDTIAVNDDISGALGKTTAEMQLMTTYTAAGWDFTNIWAIDAEINDAFPYLSSSPQSETALPITLASFSAKAKNGNVELSWETASETNNARFVIYRNDVAIASIEGAGTTSEPKSYNFTDTDVIPGVVYTYVLADIDYSNTETKYKNKALTVTLANDIVEADFVVGAAYPNPFNPSVHIDYQLSCDSDVKASIYNINGKMIKELLDNDMPAGSHELVWKAENMPSGVYVIKMLSGNAVNVQKLVLMK